MIENLQNLDISLDTLVRISTIIVSVSTPLIMIFKPNIFFRQAYMPIYQEQLSKVYSPIFQLSEPYLYTKISLTVARDLFSKISLIVDENYHLTDPKLRMYIDFVKRDIENNIEGENLHENFNYYCSYLSSTLDKTQRKVGLPIRTASYRINKTQYTNLFVFWYYLFVFLLKLSVRVLFAILCAIPVIVLLYNLISSSTLLL